MKRVYPWIAAAGLTLIVAGPALAESRTIDVDPFTAVSISSGLIGIVTEGPAQSVTAEGANAAVLNRLDVAVRNGRLEVGIEWNLLETIFSLGQRAQITVRVTAPAITAVDASAGANVDVSGAADLESLGSSSGASLDAKGVAAGALTMSSSAGASLTVAGTCDQLDADTSSGASITAVALKCARVEADASTGAHLVVWASVAITANASTGAGIEVHGNPTEVNLESSTGGNARIVP